MALQGDSAGTDSTREQPPPVHNARRGAAPIWLIVGLAIACIAVSVISSAHRADLVALEHERTLLSHALAERQNRLLREAEYIASSEDSVDRLWVRPDPEWTRQKVGMRVDKPLRSTLVAVLDPIGGSAGILVSEPSLNTESNRTALLAELTPFLTRLAGPGPKDNALGMRGSLQEPAAQPGGVAFQRLLGRPAIVAGIAIKTPAGTSQRPVLVLVNFIAERFLRNVGEQLQLPDLRLIDGDIVADDDGNSLASEGDSGETIARFVWTPNRPGVAIIWNTLPFVVIALGCFILLAGFVLRYSRRATATIAAGENRLRHLAMHDPLSNLPNRTLFGERLAACIREIRNGGVDAALLSIDLDHFKDVNDTLGHHVGDALIGAVAERLRQTLRSQDVVARLGGDEFAVLSTGSTDRESLDQVANRIIKAVTAPYAVAGHTLVIGASIGIVVINRSSCDSADIMRFADMALYRAKNEGRNRACLYDAAMSAHLTERKQLERDLRAAIEQEKLALAYQPLVSPDGERIIGVEALCRWPHPHRGSIPPSTFITVAEQSELIIPLGEWVLRQACVDGRKWPDITVAVNVSPLQFRRPDFVEVVKRILDETGFDPHCLELELTESTLLGNVEGAENAMRRLQGLGVKLALDDFGTGYSSLLYLRTFPFDKLKIDRSFVSSIESAADAAAIVHAIVSLGRGLGMRVTAEGVENANQQLFLRAAGVHAMQGFLFGKPVPAAEIAKRLGVQSPRQKTLLQLDRRAS